MIRLSFRMPVETAIDHRAVFRLFAEGLARMVSRRRAIARVRSVSG